MAGSGRQDRNGNEWKRVKVGPASKGVDAVQGGFYLFNLITSNQMEIATSGSIMARVKRTT